MLFQAVHLLCKAFLPAYSKCPDCDRTDSALRIQIKRSHTVHPVRQRSQNFPENGYILSSLFCSFSIFQIKCSDYICSWHVLAITSNCCSRVRSMNLTAYPDTRIVKFAYSGFSGCSIASRSLSTPNTLTFR